MTVQNALEEMKERAFAPAFQKYLFDTYKVPVSYTHLDVYKRQDMGSFLRRTNWQSNVG